MLRWDNTSIRSGTHAPVAAAADTRSRSGTHVPVAAAAEGSLWLMICVYFQADMELAESQEDFTRLGLTAFT